MNDSISKCCSKCKQWKPATNLYFANDRYTPDLLTRECKDCRNARARASYTKKIHEVLPDGHKRCSFCREIKPATREYFSLDRSHREGLQSACKACRKRQEAANAYLKEHAPKMYKRCPVCKEIKSIECFTMAKGRYDGHASRCKACVNRIAAEKRSQREVSHEVPTGYKQCNQCKKIKPATTDYFTKQPSGKFGLRGRCKVCMSIVRHQSREADRAYEQWYQARHPEKSRANVKNRRLRKKGVAGKYTAQQIREQYDRQKGKCYYCRCKVAWGKQHVDHTYPISRVVGTDIPANDISYLVIACPTCNMSKGNKFPHEWAEGGRLL